MIELIDLTSPTHKEKLGKKDKLLATDGEDVFMVPPEESGGGGGGYEPVEMNGLTSLIVMNRSLQTGSCSVENYVIEMLGVKAAMEGIENDYSSVIDNEQILSALHEKHYIKDMVSIQSMDFNEGSAPKIIADVSLNNADSIVLSEENLSFFIDKEGLGKWKEFSVTDLSIGLGQESISFIFDAEKNNIIKLVISVEQIGFTEKTEIEKTV